MCEKKDSAYSLRKQVCELKAQLHKTQLLVVEFLLEMGYTDASIAEELGVSEVCAHELRCEWEKEQREWHEA